MDYARVAQWRYLSIGCNSGTVTYDNVSNLKADCPLVEGEESTAKEVPAAAVLPIQWHKPFFGKWGLRAMGFSEIEKSLCNGSFCRKIICNEIVLQETFEKRLAQFFFRMLLRRLHWTDAMNIVKNSGNKTKKRA